ncbi:Lrp/AsnC family transcriptional regulator [Polaribacter vadi]|uniref:Lrp/AsnC family transcriptional regulator n=1 Tax=Polaribacter TaxID=52959 RepID=UPI001C08E57F|nr:MULTISPECIES: Lrp/AsnC family transcriptional regulator [Polaribacter]MBU3013077.1 Lrp/AsnC family transcriptional regulator [Polaribacter vadi]MDO6742895.1 Lrp/AsnC family transcriptional regulator [Polaribacter sp. 1_MG-2023]
MVDKIDTEIIKVLMKNSRQSFAEIGRIINLSPSSVRERIQKLQDIGVIKNYTLNIDNHKLGYGLEVFIMLKLFTGKLNIFMKDINTFPEIKESYRITGPYNIHMRVVLKNQLHLQQFIDKMINYGDPTTHLILSELEKV